MRCSRIPPPDLRNLSVVPITGLAKSIVKRSPRRGSRKRGCGIGVAVGRVISVGLAFAVGRRFCDVLSGGVGGRPPFRQRHQFGCFLFKGCRSRRTISAESTSRGSERDAGSFGSGGVSQAKGCDSGVVVARRHRVGLVEEADQIVVGYFTEVGAQSHDGVADLDDGVV